MAEFVVGGEPEGVTTSTDPLGVPIADVYALLQRDTAGISGAMNGTLRVAGPADVPILEARVALADGLSVSIYPSLHSCVWSHKGMHPADEVCLGDLWLTHQERQARFAGLFDHIGSLGEATREHLRASDQKPRGDGHSLVFLFDTPEGSLLYQDTSGHWSGIVRDLRPDVAIIAAAGRGNVDGEPIQGSLAQFVARQASLLRPKRVILSHHDDWLPGFSIDTDTAPIREELSRWLPRCELAEPGYLDGYEVFAGL